ncbi:MAG: SoxR reducing system RseC family protein [Thermodesulfobacteriota bacterium]|nr:SoxR reducing system RseC family protein [Thermodesulfobacteriota bacterium]
MGQGLTRTGVVTAVQGRTALVVTKEEAECESCSAKESCSTLGGSASNREVRARNTARAQVGDVVKISIQGSAFLKATFLVYMVPILALIAGTVLGYFLSKFLAGNKDLFVGIFGGLGLIGSFLWVRRKGNRLSPESEYLPEIISRRSPTKAVPPKDLSCPIH